MESESIVGIEPILLTGVCGSGALKYGDAVNGEGCGVGLLSLLRMVSALLSVNGVMSDTSEPIQMSYAMVLYVESPPTERVRLRPALVLVKYESALESLAPRPNGSSPSLPLVWTDITSLGTVSLLSSPSRVASWVIVSGTEVDDVRLPGDALSDAVT